MNTIKYMPRTSVTLCTRNTKKGKIFHACVHGKGLPLGGVERTTKILDDGTARNRKIAEAIAEQIRQHIEHQLESEYTNGINLRPDKDLVEILDEWYKDKADKLQHGEIRPNTYQYYTDIVKAIRPYFVKHPTTIKQCDKAYIVEFTRYQLDVINRSQGQTRKFLDVFSQMLEYAIKNDYILYNHMVRVEKPRKRKRKEIGWYSIDQLNTLLEKAQGTEIESIIYLCAFLGIRREEALGLLWSDIDFESDYVRIRHVYTQQGRNSLFEETTKSDNGLRKIKMGDKLHSYLIGLSQKQESEKKLCGNSYENSDFVVRRADGSRPKPNTYTQQFTRLIRENNLPRITLHGLRHSLEANTEQDGVPVSSRARLLGDDIKTLHHYDHSSQRGADEAAVKYQEKIQIPNLDKCLIKNQDVVI